MAPTDDELRALYRSERPEPPAALDDAIRRAAREEPEAAEAAPAPRGRRWLGPGLGAAAGVLLAVLVVPLALREEQELQDPVPSRHAPSAPLSDAEAVHPVQEPFSVAADAEAPPAAVARKRASSQDALEAMDPPLEESVSSVARALRAESPVPAKAAPPEAELAPALRMAPPLPAALVVLEKSGTVVRVRAGWPRHDACTTALDAGLPVEDLEVEPLGGTADGTGEGLRILSPEGPVLFRCSEEGWSAPES